MYLVHLNFELGKLAEWFTAIGTIGAVVWALVFARMQKREQLSIAALLQEKLVLVLFNSGSQLIPLTAGRLEIGRFWPVEETSVRFIWNERGMPKLIHPQEAHQFTIDLTPYVGYTPDKVYALWVKRSRLDRKIYVIFSSATGAEFRYQLSKVNAQRLATKGN